jgi:hypothetical protein
MNTYRINPFIFPETKPISATRNDGWSVPFSPDNRDYQQFLKDWENGAEVLDADGNPLPYSDEALAALEVK